MIQRFNVTLTLAIAAIIFVVVNMLGMRFLAPYRFDFTEYGIYTLSDGTREVLSKLDEPVTLRFFYSEKQAVGYPVIQAYAARVKGVLQQYKQAGNGKLKLETVNPEAFSEQEDLAVSNGVKGVPVNDSGEKLYFGVSATGATDEMMAIPYLDPDRQAFLEYDLSRLIDEAAHPKKPVVGLINGLMMQGGVLAMMKYNQPWAIFEQMQQGYDVRVLNSDVKEIPEEVQVLMVAHPDDIQPQTLEAIDQFVLKGGRVVFYLDANSITKSESPRSDMAALLKAWGVQLVPGRIAADEKSALRVQVEGDESGENRMQSAMNITWLNLTDDDTINRSDVATAQLRMVRMVESGYFALDPKAPVTAETLLMTHKPAASVTEAQVKETSDNPIPLLSMARTEKGKLPLAIRIEGKVKTAFPDSTLKDHVSASQKPIHIVLVGDADMLADGIWANVQDFYGKRIVVPTADNGNFAMNVLDSLAGNPALIGLRSRGTEDRPFIVVGIMRQAAEKKFHEEEKRIKRKLAEIEATMRELGNDRDSGEIISAAEQEQRTNFHDEMLRTRKQLRDVQRALQEDIDTLSQQLQWINIGLMPLVALALAFYLPAKLGNRRRKRA